MEQIRDQIDIARMLRAARRTKRMTGAQLATLAGCSQSAISQFEGGKTTALKDETVRKIAEILEVELSTADGADVPETAASAPAYLYCPNGECPSNVPYVVQNELILHPARQTDNGDTFCPLCGEVLARLCPGCGAPVTPSAFCTHCGQKRIEPPVVDSPALWAQTKRLEIAEIKRLQSPDR